MQSVNYKYWKANLDIRACIPCKDLQGKIYSVNEAIEPKPPVHEHCRCIIEYLKAINAGRATQKGLNGADWWLKKHRKLPNYYITYNDAKIKGFKLFLGDLGTVAPGMMLARGVYENRNGKLPSIPGRDWHEADINYNSGYRGNDRVVYSIDGLVFVTYDHYKTFVEII